MWLSSWCSSTCFTKTINFDDPFKIFCYLGCKEGIAEKNRLEIIDLFIDGLCLGVEMASDDVAQDSIPQPLQLFIALCESWQVLASVLQEGGVGEGLQEEGLLPEGVAHHLLYPLAVKPCHEVTQPKLLQLFPAPAWLQG